MDCLSGFPLMGKEGRGEGSAGFYLFSRHIESDTTSKLTLQDINTTPIEPKTERAQQRTEQRSSAEKIPALSALTLNSSTHRITPHHVSPEVKTEESKGRYDVSQRRMAKTKQSRDNQRVPGRVLPHKRLMKMCRWMGSHFHDWIDYNGVAF